MWRWTYDEQYNFNGRQGDLQSCRFICWTRQNCEGTVKSIVGFTLIEVLVAIVVLALGVLAAAAMQTSALRASSDARAIQEVTKLAEGEISFRRQNDRETYPGHLASCQSVSSLPSGFSCQVVIKPCQLVTTAGTPPTVTMSCPASSVAPADQVADQATVTVMGLRNKTITLRTVKAR